MFTKDNAQQARFSLPGARRVAVALVLLAVVALGSTSRVGSGGAFGSSWVQGPILILAALAIVATVIFGLLLAMGHAAFAGTSLRGRASVVGVVAVVLAVVVTVFLLPQWHPTIRGSGAERIMCIDPTFWWFHYPNRRGEIDRYPKRFCGWGGGGGKTISDAGGSGGTSVTLLAAVAGGAVVVLIMAAAAAAIAVRRSRRGVRAPIEEGDVVLLALDQSLEDLRRERDVRRAIIACYARMERALARSGEPRRPHEAPFEFLARVVERVAREPGRLLSELFERAKFSVEPMGVAEKEQAIAALEALRNEVPA